VCLCAYKHTCIFECIIDVSKYVHISYTQIYDYTSVCVCVRIYVYIYISQSNKWAYMHVYYTLIHTRAYICTHRHKNMYTYQVLERFRWKLCQSFAFLLILKIKFYNVIPGCRVRTSPETKNVDPCYKNVLPP
jgi:hypothetical protein